MENWGWSVGKSADQLGHYMSYALRVLKNVGLACEGITTPGGFGNRALPELAQGTLQACRDVFGAEIPALLPASLHRRTLASLRAWNTPPG